MINVILKKTNGVVEIISNPSEETINKERSYQHLCWDCDNYDKCPKVLNIKKQNINRYPFIIDGNQMINDKGEMEHFIVSRCDNFERTMVTPKTKEEEAKELKRIRQIKEELRTSYFNVDTAEEANKIQFYDLENGLIKNIQGKIPQNPNKLNKPKIKTRSKHR